MPSLRLWPVEAREGGGGREREGRRMRGKEDEREGGGGRERGERVREKRKEGIHRPLCRP